MGSYISREDFESVEESFSRSIRGFFNPQKQNTYNNEICSVKEKYPND